jgi:hypothetical protein
MRKLPLREQDLHNAPLVFPAGIQLYQQRLASAHKDVDRLTLKYNTQVKVGRDLRDSGVGGVLLPG